MSKHYVNVHLVDQAYGGPEEGGWWYTYGVPHASVPCNDEGPETLEVVRARWEAWCEEENDARTPTWSVCSEGEYRVSVADAPAKAWPSERPHYE